MASKPVFIEAVFTPSSEQAEELAKLAGADPADFEEIKVKRDFSDKFYISFPKSPQTRFVSRTVVDGILSAAVNELDAMAPLKSEEETAGRIKAAAKKALSDLDLEDQIDSEGIKAIADDLPEVEGSPKTSSIGPRYGRLRADIDEILKDVSRPLPGQMKEVRQLALNLLPKFVYYTNYGNLDSEIYLPHTWSERISGPRNKRKFGPSRYYSNLSASSRKRFWNLAVSLRHQMAALRTKTK
ncbi:MAG TPA: hypothetical protein VD837_17650 [Terriglobales bacterium]|nr:hypothetical protein [Terriglobales bacterium]